MHIVREVQHVNAIYKGLYELVKLKTGTDVFDSTKPKAEAIEPSVKQLLFKSTKKYHSTTIFFNNKCKFI